MLSCKKDVIMANETNLVALVCVQIVEAIPFLYTRAVAKYEQRPGGRDMLHFKAYSASQNGE